MTVDRTQMQRRSSLLNAWFTSLDDSGGGVLRSGRLRVLVLAGALLLRP